MYEYEVHKKSQFVSSPLQTDPSPSRSSSFLQRNGRPIPNELEAMHRKAAKSKASASAVLGRLALKRKASIIESEKPCKAKKTAVPKVRLPLSCQSQLSSLLEKMSRSHRLDCSDVFNKNNVVAKRLLLPIVQEFFMGRTIDEYEGFIAMGCLKEIGSWLSSTTDAEICLALLEVLKEMAVPMQVAKKVRWYLCARG